MAIRYASILNPGPSDRAWARAVLQDIQEECFLYPDDTKSLPIKLLPIGTVIRVETYRAVDDDGRTKWKTNAFPLAMQSDAVQALVASMSGVTAPEPTEAEQPASPSDYAEQAFTTKTLSAKATHRRRQKIAEIITKQQLSSRGAVGDAIGIAIDLCIEHGLA
jgi:hypothetical protein